jgi:hypothetical protein
MAQIQKCHQMLHVSGPLSLNLSIWGKEIGKLIYEPMNNHNLDIILPIIW